jgi:hypothetical protein
VTADSVSMDRLLASIRSVPNSLVPAPRKPDDEREHDGWQRVGAFEVHFDDALGAES